jgi:hypothetical protein
MKYAKRLAGLAAIVATCTSVQSVRADGPSVGYLVRPGSRLLEGCVNECRCVTLWFDDLRGGFNLTRQLPDPDPFFATYTVGDVHFEAPTIGWTYGGSGQYRLGGDPALTNQLQLDLQFADQLWHFDSGVVLVQGNPGLSPVIRIDINRNHLECYDTIFTLVASRTSDWNASGDRTVQDVFEFLADYFQGSGDANGNGVTGVDDIFAFLADYFAPA